MAEHVPAPIPLPNGRVEIWLMDPDAATPAWIARHLDLLAPEERRRAEDLASPRLRHDYFCTRILQRLTLSRYAAVAPAEWRFAAAPGGRPEIGLPAGAANLRFSLSGTSGLIALAIARDAPIGIDVEALVNAVDVEAVATRFFAPTERDAVLALDGDCRKAAFLRLWTLKEACLKALGTGLATALDAVRFEVSVEGLVDADFEPSLGLAPELWQFASSKPSPGHVLGLAIRRDPIRHFEIGSRWFP